MAIDDKRLIVSDFDFDDVKIKFKTFFRSSKKNLQIMILKGSGLSVLLLDILGIQYSLSWF